MKGAKHKPRRFDDVDADLELAIAEFRSRLERLEHGQVTLTVAKDRDVVIGHYTRRSHDLDEDIEAIMIMKPHKTEVGRCR